MHVPEREIPGHSGNGEVQMVWLRPPFEEPETVKWKMSVLALGDSRRCARKCRWYKCVARTLVCWKL